MKPLAKYFTILGLAFSSHAYSQELGKILVVSNAEAKVLLDGERIGKVNGVRPKKFEVSVGEHYIQIISITDKSERSEIINVEAGKQQVLKFEFEKTASSSERILIADLDFDIPGLVTANAEENFSYPFYMYAFEKGDEIILNLEMTNEKGTNVIDISTYPDGNTVYLNDSFQELKDLRIKVNERSIYEFTFGSNHAFDRDVRLTIERVAESEETKDFNTKVTWKRTYEVVQVQKPAHHFINSGSNATFRGGNSRITIPINFPPNTIKWYYTFSAFRDPEKVDEITELFDLAGQLSSLIDETGLLEFGINQLTQPPGSDYCSVDLFNFKNSQLFLAKNDESLKHFKDGSRENLSSGIIEINWAKPETMYLGIKNPSDFHGINVIVEIAAIVAEEGWMMSE